MEAGGADNDLSHAGELETVEQVRSFAQMNPKSLHSMISSWLKEDKNKMPAEEKAGRESRVQSYPYWEANGHLRCSGIH